MDERRTATDKVENHTDWGTQNSDALDCRGVGEEKGGKFRSFVCFTYFSNKWRAAAHTTDAGDVVIDTAVDPDVNR